MAPRAPGTRGPLIALALALAACGGNVIVDGTGTVTTGTGGGTSSGSGTGACRTTCLEALKEGGGVCNDLTPAGMDFAGVVTCAGKACSGPCAGISTSPANASCFTCLSSACAFPLMACTGN